MRDPLIDIIDDATGAKIAERVHLSDAMGDDDGTHEVAELRRSGVVMVGGGAAPLYRLELAGRAQ